MRNDCGEVAAGAVAAHPHPLRIGAERLGVRERPRVGSGCVFDRRRERVLGREAVVDREHVGARVPAQQPAQAVVRVEIAEHEAAAVEVRQQRLAAAVGAAVSRGIVARAKRHGQVERHALDKTHRRGLAAERDGRGTARRARLLRRERVERRLAPTLEQRQHQLHSGRERLPVHADRLAAGEADLEPRGQRVQCARNCPFDSLPRLRHVDRIPRSVADHGCYRRADTRERPRATRGQSAA